MGKEVKTFLTRPLTGDCSWVSQLWLSFPGPVLGRVLWLCGLAVLANWETKPDLSKPVVLLGVLHGDCSWDTLDMAGDCRPPDLCLCLVD